MRVVLVLFEQPSGGEKHGFGFMGSGLARALHEVDLLGGVICLHEDESLDLPGAQVRTLAGDPFFHVAMALISRAWRFIPRFNLRAAREIVFDRFVCRQLRAIKGDLLFFSRPLFPRAVKQGQELGMQTWVLASVPHPLVNFELVRAEESRLGLPCRGPYSDEKRARRLAATIASADKLLSMDPEVGKYPYETYARFLGREKIIPVKNFNSIDPPAFRDLAKKRTGREIEEGGVRFLHVSHMNLIKGIPYLLDAWRRFDAVGARKNCRLTLVGRRDENLDEVIQRDYADLPGLEVLGWVPDLFSCLADADVFISPSISDNGPGTIPEAMASGMPVIASENCGYASLITPGEDGFTYPFDDVERLTEILLWFVENRDAIPRMGGRAQRRVSDSSVDRYAEELVDIMKSAKSPHRVAEIRDGARGSG